jgi:multidrug efflux pump subunit AcrA (membrane-fusion protein)
MENSVNPKSGLVWFVLLAFSLQLCAETKIYRPHQHIASFTRQHHLIVKPRRTLAITPELGGKVTAVNVEVGDPVQGQVLLELDDTQGKLELEALKSRKQAAKARADVQELQHRAKVSEREHLERENQRQQQLLSGGGGSKQQSQALAQNLDQARFQEQILLAQHQLAIAELKQVDLACSQQEDLLERHSVKAPAQDHITYTVIERNVEVGQNVSPGQILFDLVDTERVMLSVLVDEKEWKACKEQKWRLETISGEALDHFDIYFFSPKISGNSRKRELRLEGKANAQVQGGQSVVLFIELPSSRGGLLVPQSYLGDLFGQTMVKLKDGSTIPVQVLRKEGDFTIIEPSSIPLGVELLPMSEELET